MYSFLLTRIPAQIRFFSFHIHASAVLGINYNDRDLNEILHLHMEISSSASGYQFKLERINNTLLETLRAGQVLQAKALTSTENKQVQLRIGKLDILAHTQARIIAGDKLTLQVIKAVNPLQLKLLAEISSSHIKAEAMRAALPHQASVSQLITRLTTLISQRSGSQLQPVSQQQVYPPLPEVGGAGSLKTGGLMPVAAGTKVSNTPQPPPPLVTTDEKARLFIDSLLKGGDGAKLSQTMAKILSIPVTPGQHLNAERVRLAFETSGLFLESTLATGSRPPADLKSGILELLFMLRPKLAAAQTAQQPVAPVVIDRGADLVGLLTELVSQAEGSMARIVFNQLSSLPGDDTNHQLWQFDLPLRQGEKSDRFRVQIERETKQRGGGKAETLWSAKLDFDLEPTGPVHARLALMGEEISSRFTAEYSETAHRLDQALPHLANAFSRAGLKVGTLSATQGTSNNESRPSFPILDEKA